MRKFRKMFVLFSAVLMALCLSGCSWLDEALDERDSFDFAFNNACHRGAPNDYQPVSLTKLSCETGEEAPSGTLFLTVPINPLCLHRLGCHAVPDETLTVLVLRHNIRPIAMSTNLPRIELLVGGAPKMDRLPSTNEFASHLRTASIYIWSDPALTKSLGLQPVY